MKFISSTMSYKLVLMLHFIVLRVKQKSIYIVDYALVSHIDVFKSRPLDIKMLFDFYMGLAYLTIILQDLKIKYENDSPI